MPVCAQRYREGCRRELAAELSQTPPCCSSVLSKPSSAQPLQPLITHHCSERKSPSAFLDIVMQSQSTCPHLKGKPQQKHLQPGWCLPWDAFQSELPQRHSTAHAGKGACCERAKGKCGSTSSLPPHARAGHSQPQTRMFDTVSGQRAKQCFTL